MIIPLAKLYGQISTLLWCFEIFNALGEFIFSEAFFNSVDTGVCVARTRGESYKPNRMKYYMVETGVILSCGKAKSERN